MVARLLAAIPSEPAAPPVRYTAGLVACVASVCAVALVVAGVTVRAPSDVALLAVGAVATALLDLVRVRSVGGLRSPWSPTVFVHLALTLTLGAVGALTTAIVGSAATAIRLRTGWLRAAFNVADFFLANMAALAVFHGIQHVSHDGWWNVVAGAILGLACYAVNYALLAGVVRVAAGTKLRAFFADVRGIIPHDVAFGIAAAVFSVSAPSTWRLVGWLVLVASVQGFVLRIARYVRERVELLQQIVTVAGQQRAKTARDLHDGPIAHLSGLAMILSGATSSMNATSAAVVENVADELRQTAVELREQIFLHAPHDLDKPGHLRDAIQKQLAPLIAQGVDAEADIPDVVPLDGAALELVYRVCAEALTNTLRYAKARHVRVQLTATEREVIVTVDDDGKGFSPEQLLRQRQAGHFGTRFREEEAEIAGGTFTISSKPGEGAHVRLVLPIPLAP